MAASDGGERTEKPTGKRRAKARREGQATKSYDVNATFVLFATLAVLGIEGRKLLASSEGIMAGGLARAGTPDAAGSAGIHGLAMWGMRAFAGTAAPVVIAALVAGVVANVLQTGLRFTPKVLKPSFAKINLAKGLKRMIAPGQLVELSKTLAKTGVIAGVAFSAVWSRLSTMGVLVGAPPGQLVGMLGSLIFSIAIRVAAALAVLAAADFVWQRYRHEKSLKMSKEEVRNEARESDVAPEVKGQIRRKQTEAARRRMLADVPTADVVVVNPTHYAVALRYDGSKPAPELVAKGVDLLARKIREIAEEAGVTIVHEPPLARALYRDVELGQMIPEELYAAVAEVLAFVFRIAGRRRLVA